MTRQYKILYWTYDNWSGDPSEMMIESEIFPTKEYVESLIWREIQSMKVEVL